MNTRSSLMLLVAFLLIIGLANTHLSASIWGYGIEGGVAKGDNGRDDENLVPTGRGHLQLGMSEQLMVRFGMGYAPIKAHNRYDAKILQGDARLLFRPVQMQLLSPYLYAGIGGGKDVGDSKSDFFPVVPFGFGFQSKLSPSLLIDLNAGYNLALSDDMDGIVRPDTYPNRYTNKKHDGYFTIMMGIVLTKPSREKVETIEIPVRIPVDPKALDTDKDGLSDADEKDKHRTDPLKMDTDMDGLSDGDEVLKHRTDPLKPDTDNDGLNDGMEVNQYKTDPLKADSDNDGLTDYAEVHTHLSNPMKLDSDGGGLNDGAEVRAGKNPLDSKDDGPVTPEVTTPKADATKMDSDGDGLSDDDETKRYRTDPKVSDTDRDALNDGVEVNQYRTDPTKADTDGDGLNDYAEVMTHRTDPLMIDTDGGGMNDGAEIKAGKNPLDAKDDGPVIPEAPKPDTSKTDTDGDGLTDLDEQQKYRTDITNKDTDGDGLSDGDEVLKHRTDPLMSDSDKDGLSDGLEINQYKTDPLKADTDGDGLNDHAEVMTHRTDPLKIDTDGGGMNDGAEITGKKNPLDPKDDLLDLSKGKKVVLDGITFASGSATILPESRYILDKVLESLNANPDVNVQIVGHTDSVGSETDNRSLSLRRAQAVKDWLTGRGINSSRIKAIGRGEAEPIASNDTSDGRSQNRRIEFQVEN